jgi:hypothetical protein
VTRVVDDEDGVTGGVVRRGTAARHGRAVFFPPSGELGPHPALFDEAIGAMMVGDR